MSEKHTRKNSKSKHRTPPPTGFSLLLLKNSGLGISAGLLLCVILLLCGTALLLNLPNPHAPLGAVSLGILYLSALSVGFITRRLHGTAPLLCGTISGGGLFLLFGLVAAFFPDTTESTSLLPFLLRL